MGLGRSPGGGPGGRSPRKLMDFTHLQSSFLKMTCCSIFVYDLYSMILHAKKNKTKQKAKKKTKKKPEADGIYVFTV